MWCVWCVFGARLGRLGVGWRVCGRVRMIFNWCPPKQIHQHTNTRAQDAVTHTHTLAHNQRKALHVHTCAAADERSSSSSSSRWWWWWSAPCVWCWVYRALSDGSYARAWWRTCGTSVINLSSHRAERSTPEISLVEASSSTERMRDAIRRVECTYLTHSGERPPRKNESDWGEQLSCECG